MPSSADSSALTNKLLTDRTLLRASIRCWIRNFERHQNERLTAPTQTALGEEAGVSRKVWTDPDRSPVKLRDDLAAHGAHAYQQRRIPEELLGPGRTKHGVEHVPRPKPHELLLGMAIASLHRGMDETADRTEDEYRRGVWVLNAHRLAGLALEVLSKAEMRFSRRRRAFADTCLHLMKQADQFYPGGRRLDFEMECVRARAFLDAVDGRPLPQQDLSGVKPHLVDVLLEEQIQAFVDGLIRSGRIEQVHGAIQDWPDSSTTEVSPLEYALERLALATLDPELATLEPGLRSNAYSKISKEADRLLKATASRRELLAQDQRRVQTVRAHFEGDPLATLRNAFAGAPSLRIAPAHERYYQFDLLAAIAYKASLTDGTAEGPWRSGVIRWRLQARSDEATRPFLEPEIRAIIDTEDTEDTKDTKDTKGSTRPQITNDLERLGPLVNNLRQDAWISAVASLFNERVEGAWGRRRETADELRDHANRLIEAADFLELCVVAEEPNEVGGRP